MRYSTLIILIFRDITLPSELRWPASFKFSQRIDRDWRPDLMKNCLFLTDALFHIEIGYLVLPENS
jgi:hypothetical protein